MAIPKLQELSKEQFTKLKESGYLWEFYPEATDKYEEIRHEEFGSVENSKEV